MYERCLNEAERILAAASEVVLPIKHVWKQLAEEGKRRSFDVPSLTDFDALLEGDKRFEILSAQTEPDEIESLISGEGEEIDSTLGTLGFYPEDRVKLRRIRLPSRTPDGQEMPRESEEEEELEPLNVKGLSATRPGHIVETKKTAAKKSPAPSVKGGKPRLKPQSKRRPRTKSKPRKQSTRPLRKSR